ncbi:MAG: hypothetical protein R3337_00550 [Gammaproteobacteria bacterium]|nr:hypothetical protein [Gammaproteobacteria bacterium]
MDNITDMHVPTKAELIRATAIALVVAVAVLVTTILPAEYGVDPIGAGRALGLDKLNASSLPTAEITRSANAIPLEGAALASADVSLKMDALTVVVPAYEGIELKATMKAGQTLVFDWRTDGAALYTDMHGEPPNPAENEFTSYWKENEQTAGRGALIASFDGTHGWYWQNMNEEPVTITAEVSGFYQDIRQIK